MKQNNAFLKELEAQIVRCRLCPRLVAWREEVASVKRRAFMAQEYWGKPVPGFGNPQARVLVLGLAPGAHGSNRTGRMFTGDGSGDFLYPALYRAGFVNQPIATDRQDGLTLKDLFITAICRCAPPANKPDPQEIQNCRPWLEAELELLTQLKGVVLLGKMALEGWLALPACRGLDKKNIVFGHAKFYEGQNGLPWLLCSYHPSRQNTQTGKLTADMFDEVWQIVRQKLFE
ncbi:MAG: uracil-DNA glycosylase [Anaerolineaceae bacterium]|nr:uracil-DNA glycosylase [Anaerolineaceae bacterium]